VPYDLVQTDQNERLACLPFMSILSVISLVPLFLLRKLIARHPGRVQWTGRKSMRVRNIFYASAYFAVLLSKRIYAHPAAAYSNHWGARQVLWR